MADKQEETAEEPKGGKKKLIIMIVCVLLLVGISVGVTIMLIGGSSEPVATAEVVEPEKPVKEEPTYVELKPFTVNLSPDDPVGFLQVKISVLTYFSAVADEIEENKPLIRNNLSLLFGEQKSADLRSQEGKQTLQKKVKDSVQQVINTYGSGGEIDNIYFTTFVMQ